MDQLTEQVKVHIGFKPQQAAAAVTGTGIDRVGYESALVLLNVGEVDAGSHSTVFKVQESESLSTGYADVTGATETVITESGMTAIAMNLKGRKQYIRVVATPTLTTAAYIELGSTIVLGNSQLKPQSN